MSSDFDFSEPAKPTSRRSRSTEEPDDEPDYDPKAADVHGIISIVLASVAIVCVALGFCPCLFGIPIVLGFLCALPSFILAFWATKLRKIAMTLSSVALGVFALATVLYALLCVTGLIGGAFQK